MKTKWKTAWYLMLDIKGEMLSGALTKCAIVFVKGFEGVNSVMTILMLGLIKIMT